MPPNHLMHLITHGQKPKAIQIDGGKEFVNDKLKSWCRERGIDNHITAPLLTIAKQGRRTYEQDTCRAQLRHASSSGLVRIPLGICITICGVCPK
jgi:hypothetical protein